MSFATDLLRQAGLLISEPTATTTKTARGPVRLKKDGTPDRRSLLRGISKPSRLKGTMYSYEKKQLLKAFESTPVGESFEWKWRNRATKADTKLRNRQLTYCYETAKEFGFRVSLSSRATFILVTMRAQIAD